MGGSAAGRHDPNTDACDTFDQCYFYEDCDETNEMQEVWFAGRDPSTLGIDEYLSGNVPFIEVNKDVQ